VSETKGEITLRFLAQPKDADFGGHVHGGSVMKWIDQAGYVRATGWRGNLRIFQRFVTPLTV